MVELQTGKPCVLGTGDNNYDTETPSLCTNLVMQMNGINNNRFMDTEFISAGAYHLSFVQLLISTIIHIHLNIHVHVYLYTCSCMWCHNE